MWHTQEVTSIFSQLFFSMYALFDICLMEQKVLVYFTVFQKMHILFIYVYIPYAPTLSSIFTISSFCDCLLSFLMLQRLCVFVILCPLWMNACWSEPSKARHFQFFVAYTVWPLPSKVKSDVARTPGNH